MLILVSDETEYIQIIPRGCQQSGNDDTSDEVLGVKEYAYSGVFEPISTQCDVVEGIFPDDADGELGESALLFTLGVTNAGKT